MNPNNYNHVAASLLQQGCMSGSMVVPTEDFVMFSNGKKAFFFHSNHNLNDAQVTMALKTFYEMEKLPATLLTNYINDPSDRNFDNAINYLSNATINRYKHEGDLGNVEYLNSAREIITRGANNVGEFAAKHNLDPQISNEFVNGIKNKVAVLDNMLDQSKSQDA